MMVTPAFGWALPPNFDVETVVVSGVSYLTTMAFLDHNDFFVLEKVSGNVKRVQLPGPTITTVLTVSVDTSGESGMLGIALHPEFASNSWVFLCYTNRTPREHWIVRFTWDGTALADPIVIASFPTSAWHHNGGIILFGPDRKLYAVIGDQNNNSQTLNDSGAAIVTRGVILRLNDDGTTPADNPLAATPGWERYYAYGIRNSFGLAFDPLSGMLWDTENGDSTYDEVNPVARGMNSGWRRVMGPVSRDGQGVSDLVMVEGAVYVDPAFSWYATIAPTGICFPGNCRWPGGLRYDCFVGDVRGFISRFRLNASRIGFLLQGGVADGVADSTPERNQVRWISGFGTITDLKIGPDGYMYVVSYFGAIHRIRPINPMGDLNLDGNVTTDDMPLFTSALLGEGLTPQELAVADFDGDGGVTGMDIACFVTSLQMPN